MRTSRYALTVAVCAAATATAQAPNPEVERHIAAARAAAGEHAAMVDRLCPQPGVARQPVQGNRSGPPTTPPRESWHAEPVKVFDNFYFVGMTEYSAWAVTTSEGIIVVDPLFD
jgi:metallo-beta-lactamase class B